MIPHFIKSRKLRKFNVDYYESYGEISNDVDDLSDALLGHPHEIKQGHVEEDAQSYDDCHLVCSDLGNGKHMPVIDLDFSCFLQDSTTEGHHHLYINKEVEWDDYVNLLDALAKCGIIEAGYAGASKGRKYTAVRKPGLKKGSIIEGKI